MDRLAHEQEDSPSETESESIETGKGVSFGNSAQSFGHSLGFGLVDQRSRRERRRGPPVRDAAYEPHDTVYSSHES